MQVHSILGERPWLPHKRTYFPQALLQQQRNKRALTTDPLNEVVNQFTTISQTTTVQGTVTDDKDVVPVVSDSKLAIILSAASLATSLVTMLSMLLLVFQLKREIYKLKSVKSEKKELPKMEEFAMHIKPTHTFHTYTSPIYNPYFNGEKDDM